MAVTTRWLDTMRFVSTDSGGHAIVVDGTDDDVASQRGFRPPDLLLASLAGCSGADVVGILQKQRQRVTSLEIRVEGDQDPDPPWIYREVRIHYVMHGRDLKEDAVRRAIELSEQKYCAVAATISGRARVVSTYELHDVE